MFFYVCEFVYSVHEVCLNGGVVCVCVYVCACVRVGMNTSSCLSKLCVYSHVQMECINFVASCFSLTTLP